MDRFLFYLYRAAWGTLGRLPLPLCFELGRLLGSLFHIASPKYRRLARKNMARSLGSEVSEKEIHQLVSKHFALLGANLCSTARLSRLSPAALDRHVEIDASVGVVKKTQQSGRSVVVILGHYSNWELLPIICERVVNSPSGALYQRIANKYIDEHVRISRGTAGLELFERRNGLARALRILREAGAVGIFADQNSGASGVWAPFFRRLTSTTPLPGLMAARTGAMIVQLTTHLVGRARWRVTAGPEIIPGGSEAQTAAVVNHAIEKQILLYPAEWFWVHDRWKIPESEFLLGRARRGLALSVGDGTRGEADPPVEPFRIVVRSPNWLGDAVMAIPAVRAIKAGRPDAEVTVVTPAKIADIWKILPEADRVIPIPPKSGVRQVARQIKAAMPIPADVAVLFPNSLRSALEARAAGIDYLVGYAGHSRRKLLSKIITPPRRREPPPHQIDRYLLIAEKCGSDTAPYKALEGVFSQDELGTENLVCICPGAEYGPAKRWPADRFAETAILTAQAHPDLRWAIVGVARDKALGDEIAAAIGETATNHCGETDLAGLIDLLRRSRALLTNDTGTMHLSMLIGTPVVAVFGSTEPSFTGPRFAPHRILRRHTPCAPCFLRKCPLDFACMLGITSGEAAATLLETLDARA